MIILRYLAILELSQNLEILDFSKCHRFLPDNASIPKFSKDLEGRVVPSELWLLRLPPTTREPATPNLTVAKIGAFKIQNLDSKSETLFVADRSGRDPVLWATLKG